MNQLSDFLDSHLIVSALKKIGTAFVDLTERSVACYVNLIKSKVDEVTHFQYI
jgi:hypothetical protein